MIPVITRLIVCFDEKRGGYVWKLSLSSKKISAISPKAYTRKCDAKRNGLRFVERANKVIRLVDVETGTQEILQTNGEVEDYISRNASELQSA